jgi:hypothetical protein
MANTKKLDTKARKKAKRKMRIAVKDQLASLSLKERKELRKFEGTKSQFLRELAAKKTEPTEPEKAEAAATTTEESA